MVLLVYTKYKYMHILVMLYESEQGEIPSICANQEPY
jgi:hypothetical protein